MRMAIIGGSGFLGSVLSKMGVDEGWNVDVYDTEPPIGLSGGVRFLRCNILAHDLEIQNGTDAVFYLAQSPYYRMFPERADHLFGVNVIGAIKAAQLAMTKKCSFFCHASTGSVYQPCFSFLSEKHPVRKDNPYAMSKVTAEDVLRLFSQSAMQIVSVRLFGLFGRNQRAMLPAIIHERILKRTPVVLYPKSNDDPSPQGLLMSFCYVQDAASSLIGLSRYAMSGQKLPDIINIGGPETVSIKQFASAIGDLIHLNPIFEISSEKRSFDLIADTSLLHSLISIEFTPFKEAIKKSYGRD